MEWSTEWIWKYWNSWKYYSLNSASLKSHGLGWYLKCKVLWNMPFLQTLEDWHRSVYLQDFQLRNPFDEITLDENQGPDYLWRESRTAAFKDRTGSEKEIDLGIRGGLGKFWRANLGKCKEIVFWYTWSGSRLFSFWRKCWQKESSCKFLDFQE